MESGNSVSWTKLSPSDQFPGRGFQTAHHISRERTTDPPVVAPANPPVHPSALSARRKAGFQLNPDRGWQKA